MSLPLDPNAARAELKELRRERKSIMDQYGDMAQRHPMHVHIGGLNPAAQRLYYLRRSIAHLEGQLKPAKSVLTPKLGFLPKDLRTKSGLLYEIRKTSETAGATIGRSWGDQRYFYLIVNGQIVPGEYKTLGQAVKAFEKGLVHLTPAAPLDGVIDLGRKG